MGETFRPQPMEAGGQERSRSDFETAKEALETQLEVLLETHAEALNEGNNGVILKIELSDVAPDIAAAFKAAGWDLGTEQVAKVLKVYGGGRGRQEYEMQKAAHAILSERSQGAAAVPAPRYYADIRASAELREKLRRSSQGFGNSERIEILLMDEVKGTDIATLLYREVVRRHPESAHLAAEADDLDFRTLQEEVSRVMRFAAPGGKGRTEAERAFEDEKVSNENQKRMIDWLDKQGFQVDPRIADGIAAAMDALHDGGMAYRDAHPRNFMVEGGLAAGAATPPRVYVIDFGSAVRFEGRYADVKETLFQDEKEGRRYPSDELTVNILKPLTAPPEERGNAEAKRYAAELESLLGRMHAKANPKLKAYMESLPATVSTGAADQRKGVAMHAISPAASNIDYLLAPLSAAVAEGSVDAATARAYLAALMPNLKTEDRNKAARFAGTIG